MTDNIRIVPRGYENPQREFSPELRRAGWAPGNYYNVCHDCGKKHIADKRASRCVECAEKVWAQHVADAKPTRVPFTLDEIHAAEIEAASDAVLRRLYDWIMAGENDAQTAFTASELRNVAREIEYRIHAAREEGRRAGMMEAAQVAWRFNVCDPWASKIAAAIKSKSKEG